jgi:hypothetical protein
VVVACADEAGFEGGDMPDGAMYAGRAAVDAPVSLAGVVDGEGSFEITLCR